MILYSKNFIKNFYKLSKTHSIYFFLITTWILLCFSINTHPYEIHEMFNDPIKFLNGLRFILPTIAVIMSFLFSIYIIYFKKKKNISPILILFFLYFISQIFGLLNTSEREFNLDNSYLVLFGIGTLSIIFILDNFRSNKITFCLIISFLIILFFAYFSILISSIDMFLYSILDGNLYNIFNPHDVFMEQALPRITGLTRSFAIFTLFFLKLFLIEKKNVIINYLIFVIIISLFFFVWMGQSRGSLLCYIVASFFLVFFLNDLSFYKKLIILISIPTISIFLNVLITSKSTSIIEYAKNNLEIDDKVLLAIDKKISQDSFSKNSKKKIYTYRVINNETSSGRIVIWTKIANIYEKNKIFGYGPQGDRYILYNTEEADYFSTNSSNLFVYGFVSGGYFGLILLIAINIYILILLKKYATINDLFALNYKLNKKRFVEANVVFIIFFQSEAYLKIAMAFLVLIL